MDFNSYQAKAATTAIYPSIGQLVVNNSGKEYMDDLTQSSVQVVNASNPYYPALGLAGEVGEYCNKLKKVMRDQGGNITVEFKEMAKGELGDILWYLSECATSLEISLDEIAEDNIDKLFSRKERGVLQGSGDQR